MAKKQTIKEQERIHNERQLAILAINLAAAIARASEAGYSIRTLSSTGPRYLAQLEDNLKALHQGYKSAKQKVSADLAQCYDTQICGIFQDKGIREGLNRWEGSLPLRL
jgi:hypothetical protein